MNTVFVSIFSALNLEVALANILVFLFVCIFAKAVLSYVAMNYNGSVIATISFEMRADYLNSTLLAKWSTVQEVRAGESLNTLNMEIPKAASVYRYACVLLASMFQLIVLWYLMLVVSIYGALGGILLGLGIFLLLSYFVSLCERAKRSSGEIDEFI